jgi:hypothetical protein
MLKNTGKITAGLIFLFLTFYFLSCDHSPLGKGPTEPEETATPTPAPTATPVLPTATPTPGPTPTPGTTPTPTPSSLTGTWNGTSQDTNTSGDATCTARTDSLRLDIVQAGSDLTISIYSDSFHLDPLGPTVPMVTQGTLTGDSFTSHGELSHSGNQHTTVDLNGTVSGDTITGDYSCLTCYTDTGVCYCYKGGTFTVSR